VRPLASLELVRADLALHRVEELGPLVGLELGDELPRPLRLAFRAGQVIDHFVDLVEDLEDVGAVYTFVIIEGHGKRLRYFRDSGLGIRASGKKKEVFLIPMPESGIRKPIAR
jgi:hypothetical protein